MKRLLAIIAVIAVAGLTPWALGSSVFAQTPTQPEETETQAETEMGTETETETENERLEAARERAQDARATAAERREALCTIIQDRLSKRTASIEQVTETHLDVYQNLLDRLEALIQSASDKGYDTTELTTTLTSLADKVTDFSTASEELRATLGDSGSTCSDETRYGALISEGRSNIRVVRDAARDIRTTFREEVIPALKDYREWVSQNNSGTEGTTEEETETSDES